MIELKPCPFCGAKVYIHEYGEYYAVRCANIKCLVRPMTELHKNKTVVVRWWNRRAE